jgi:DNA polymerase (family 10)
VRRKTQRILLPQASALAEEILDWLRKSKVIVRADPLGSLRRQVSTVGDIDIAVATNSPKDAIKYFISYPKKKKVLEAGKTTASILLNGGQQVDLMVQPTSSYGALLQHLTGSKHHNIALRELALKKGFSLSEYGIKRKMKNGKWKMEKYDTEEKFYQSLGLDFIPPEMREDTGEIEAAQNHQLPQLLEEKEIKGDFHLHSNFPIEESHDPGTDSMEKMVKKAEELKYEYIGFSEHNPSLNNHSEKQIINLLKAKKIKIEQLNYSRTNKLLKRIYNGLEVDVRPDGKLALPGKALELLDYVIASIHSSFRMDSEEMTKRVLEGLAPKKVKILGHPTGRLLNKREGYELNWDKIFDFCLKNEKWLEINAWPARLDLPDSLVREAVKNGVKIIINTDAHSTEEMDLMPFGVSVARRGWAEKDDIVNALDCDKINQEIFRKEVK